MTEREFHTRSVAHGRADFRGRRAIAIRPPESLFLCIGTLAEVNRLSWNEQALRLLEEALDGRTQTKAPPDGP